MHRLMAGATILEHELSELRLLVERQTGILLDCPNSALAAHVAEYLESEELESAAALLERFRASDCDPAVTGAVSGWSVKRQYGLLSPSRGDECAGTLRGSADLPAKIRG